MAWPIWIAIRIDFYFSPIFPVAWPYSPVFSHSIFSFYFNIIFFSFFPSESSIQIPPPLRSTLTYRLGFSGEFFWSRSFRFSDDRSYCTAATRPVAARAARARPGWRVTLPIRPLVAIREARVGSIVGFRRKNLFKGTMPLLLNQALRKLPSWL